MTETSGRRVRGGCWGGEKGLPGGLAGTGQFAGEACTGGLVGRKGPHSRGEEQNTRNWWLCPTSITQDMAPSGPFHAWPDTPSRDVPCFPSLWLSSQLKEALWTNWNGRHWPSLQRAGVTLWLPLTRCKYPGHGASPEPEVAFHQKSMEIASPHTPSTRPSFQVALQTLRPRQMHKTWSRNSSSQRSLFDTSRA